MENRSFQSWSNAGKLGEDANNLELEEDANNLAFPFTSQLPSLDFSGGGFLGSGGLEPEFDFTFPDPLAFDPVPLMDLSSVNYGRRYHALAINPLPNMFQGNFWHGSNEFRLWNEALNEAYDQHAHAQNNQLLETVVQDSPMLQQQQAGQNNIAANWCNNGKEKADEGIIIGSHFKNLSRKEISKFFYLPITQAAKELNVGLTLLKKRCRELGIRRWPHRKLMSIQTLIKNVQKMKEMGHPFGHEHKLKEAIELLENEQKMLEETPDQQLEDYTKRLRQACFKANYKKRRMMANNNMMHEDHLQAPPFPNPISAAPPAQYAGFRLIEGKTGNFVDYEQMQQHHETNQCAVSDCFSSTNSGF